MLFARTRLPLVSLALTLALAACGDDHHHHEEEAQFICDGTEDSLAPGTSKVGDSGNLTMTLVQAIPEVHYVQNNELLVTVTDSNGTLLSDANFTSILPFTAKHDHGTPIPTLWEATANEGEYRIYDINYVHRGPWRLDVEFTAGGVSDSMRWVFCIEELPGSADAG